MSTSDLIKPFHLERLAIIYIRQSSPHQALTNQESTRLQYALQQRALELGWHEHQIRIIDEDQGRTARTTEGRHGLKELATLLTLEHVGIITCRYYLLHRGHPALPQLLRLVSVA
jgi:DNA invertase Pin-like site-specific DNA recombinase